MSKQGPPLGATVVFSHYYDRPTDQELEARNEELEGADGTITLVRRENPEPHKTAVVVGISRVAYEAYLDENGRGDVYAAWSTATVKASFYVVKRSLRGRRFLVKLEDMDGLP